MKRIVNLLNEKNHYLEKFYALNETEIKNFLSGNFDNLEYFYNSREKILEIIKYIDAQIDEAHNKMNVEVVAMAESLKADMRAAMQIKEEYVAHILEQDLQVLSCIESAKNGIIRELRELRKGKKAVSGYKSPSFSKRLDEEV